MQEESELPGPGPCTVLPRGPLGDSWAVDETSVTLGDLACER